MPKLNTKNIYQSSHYLNWFVFFFFIRIIEKKDKELGNQNSFIFVREEDMVSTKMNFGLYRVEQLGLFFHT